MHGALGDVNYDIAAFDKVIKERPAGFALTDDEFEPVWAAARQYAL